MKNKLYSILIGLSLTLWTSCDKGGTETVNMSYEETTMQATAISPSQGYVGEQVTISGSGFSASTEFTKVYFGDFQGVMVGCSEESIVVKVPEEAVSSKIFLEFLGKKSATNLTFTVLDDPELTVTSSLTSLYAGKTITLTGTGMPSTADDLTATVGSAEAEITSYTVDADGNATMEVTVDASLSAGTTTLTVQLFDRTIFTKRLTVLAAPVVNGGYAKWLVIPGGTLEITGSGFRAFADEVQVDFNGTVVDADKVTDNLITVTVPTGFTEGTVTVALGDFDTFELGTLTAMTVGDGGDVTSSVLENSVQPFTPNSYTEGSTSTTIPDGWTYDYSGNFLLFSDTYPQGVLAFASSNINKKVYQVARLPKGTYTFTLEVAECSTTSGRFGVMFAVAEGSATIPDLQVDVWTLQGDALASYLITGTRSQHTKEVTLTLSEDTEVTIGFVIQLTNDGIVRLSSIGVAYAE